MPKSGENPWVLILASRRDARFKPRRTIPFLLIYRDPLWLAPAWCLSATEGRHGSRGFLELLEPQRQPISIRPIFRPARQLDPCAGDPFEANFEKRTIVDFKQPVGDMNSEIGIDRLPKLLVRVHDDVRGIEQSRLGQMGNCASASMRIPMMSAGHSD